MNNTTSNKAAIFAKNLIKNIENETIKRKIPPNPGEKYSPEREELALYQFKRYIGSLRCLIDRQTVKDIRNYDIL